MSRPTLWHRLARFWHSDRGLSAFLGFLFLTIFLVYPMAETGVLAGVLIDVSTGVLLVSGVVAAWGSRRLAIVAAVLATADVAARVAHAQTRLDWLGALECVLVLSTVTLLAAVVLVQTFRGGDVTFHRIQGAIAVYLLIGLAFAYAYRLVFIAVPDAFQRSPAVWATGHHAPWLLYFSFATLTTTGFGDIIPLHPAARTLAILESICGLLFPAIFIGRVVALELESRKTRGH